MSVFSHDINPSNAALPWQQQDEIEKEVRAAAESSGTTTNSSSGTTSSKSNTTNPKLYSDLTYSTSAFEDDVKYNPYPKGNKVSDGGISKKIAKGIWDDQNGITKKLDKQLKKAVANSKFDSAKQFSNEILSSSMASSNIRDPKEIDIFTQTYRFGLLNTDSAISTSREFLFFTKPDLNIFGIDTGSAEYEQSVNTSKLNSGLENIVFWQELFSNKRGRQIMKLLQSSAAENNNKFNHLLQNQVVSNLEIPSLSAETIDTPQNMYGVGYSYRGSSEGSDDNVTFSLEFKDTRWLDVYTFFKAYDNYEILKHHGVIEPKLKYILNKVIHDQFAIYKFLVDEDLETIIYYGKMYGVMPVSLPRDVFSSPTFDNGLSYSVDFKAAFYEDMDPNILADFNALNRARFKSAKYSLPIYNPVLDKVDTRPATAAYVIIDKDSVRARQSPRGFIYKLCWKGKEQPDGHNY